MKNNYKLDIEENESGKRLDVSIINKLPFISRSSLKSKSTHILVNGKMEKLSYKCRMGDVILIEIIEEDIKTLQPENININIIYEDENYIIINKDHGIVVHPSKGMLTGTLVNGLLGMKKELSYNDDIFRTGIVHRIDKDTSGLLLITKNERALNYTSELFKTRKITKKYHAIVKGFFMPSYLEIDNNIGRHPKLRKKMTVLQNSGKKSVTIIENVEHFDKYSYLDILLVTGRTHQIRVHLSHYGFPVLGDKVYSRRDHNSINIPLCLVAYKLSFYDIFSKKTLNFEIEDPTHMKKIFL